MLSDTQGTRSEGPIEDSRGIEGGRLKGPSGSATKLQPHINS